MDTKGVNVSSLTRHARLGRRVVWERPGEITVKHCFPKRCALALLLAAGGVLGGCAQLDLCAERIEPAEACVTPPDTGPEPSGAGAGASGEEAPAVAVPSTVRLDPEGETAPAGGPARLAADDGPAANAAAYPGLSPAELEHYMVGRHIGYQEAKP